MSEYLDEADIRKRIEKRFKARQELRIHAAAFVLTNVCLWIFWLLITPSGITAAPNGIVTTTPVMGFPWPLFVTAGWGIGIVAHILNYYSKYGGGAERREEAIQREIERYHERVGTYEKPKNDQRGNLEINDDGEIEDSYDDEAWQGGSRKRG